MSTKSTYRKFPDTIIPDGGKPVRLIGLNPETVLRIRGRELKAKDIPLSFFTLQCGHTGRGIAVIAGDTVFCPECSIDQRVSRARG